MSRKTFLGEYVFVLFLLLPLVASITGCNPAEQENLLDLYKREVMARVPGGCNCRDNCNRSIMAPAQTLPGQVVFQHAHGTMISSN